MHPANLFFSALKSKGNTPKYGLLYNSTFIGRAEPKCKGRISRYVANKCSIASRIDCFSESLTDKFGLEMKEQVEERLRFYATGDAPRKNVDVMKAVLDSLDIKVYTLSLHQQMYGLIVMSMLVCGAVLLYETCCTAALSYILSITPIILCNTCAAG